MSIDFLYLSEEDMIWAGVLDADRCVKTMEDVMSLFGKGDYIMGGPKGDEHGLQINFPKAKDIADFPLDNGPDRRFNAMLTATTFEEFAYHLRQLFKQGKSKSAFSVNFPRLAGDLFWYQNGNSKQVCLKWARDYYKTEPKTDQTATETINQTVNPAQ